MKKRILFLLLFFSVSSFAQNSPLGNWIFINGNKKINNRWNWTQEVQYRNYNFFGDLEQLLLRTGVGYTFNGSNNILLGSAYILSENYTGIEDEKLPSHEHRIYQQFITKHKIGRASLQHRYRFEERWLKKGFQTRFRYFLSVNYPLGKTTMTDKTFYLSAYNEIFLHTQNNYFDRLRLYGGIGYMLNSKLKFELGYMNQAFNSYNRDQLNLILHYNY